jgi:hypothetical protein
MNLHQLNYFLQIAELRSFTRAVRSRAELGLARKRTASTAAYYNPSRNR